MNDESLWDEDTYKDMCNTCEHFIKNEDPRLWCYLFKDFVFKCMMHTEYKHLE